MPDACVTAAVVGVGTLGRQHARVYAELPEARLVGVHDVDEKRAAEVAERHGCRVFSRLEDLAAEAAAVSVAVPTVDHHRVCRSLLAAGRDVLVEKPITVSLEEADELIQLAADKRAVLQVGHIERFNPATEILRERRDPPRFIEVHRLASFSPRSLDIDVILDLMIHDLDIVLSLDGSDPVQVDAVGVPVLTEKFDIANVRIRFASGLIANLTASRISAEKLRKFRLWFPRTYISLDFAARESQIFRLVEGGGGRPEIRMEQTGASAEEPLARQIRAFLTAVRDRSGPLVSGEDGRRALWLAHLIREQLESA